MIDIKLKEFQTWFLGAAGEVPFDDLTAGVISSTDSTSILLLVRGDLPITTYMLHEDNGPHISANFTPSWPDPTCEDVSSETLPGKTLPVRTSPARLFPVDGVVVLLGVVLLPVLEVGPSTDVLQTLLGVPHRDQLLGLEGGHGQLYSSDFILRCSPASLRSFADSEACRSPGVTEPEPSPSGTRHDVSYTEPLGPGLQYL
ncbi:hypothetical protein EYF80_047811 [Liparis tanakae]|uniref:Uncharacterized protein n=1 Tax=Liparis tanakae TaxID=230148 RepID=A0A4Z2FLH0_9TELE|nr:hypothetical protein EYF80_047811 [Liparis tanakae]